MLMIEHLHAFVLHRRRMRSLMLSCLSWSGSTALLMPSLLLSIKHVILSLLLTPVGEARLPMPKGMAYKD
jgi:hypothetical protein